MGATIDCLWHVLIEEGTADRSRFRLDSRRLNAFLTGDTVSNLLWRRASTIWLAAQIRISASQMVYAVIGHGLDPDRDVAGDEIDRRDAMRLGQRKEGIGHEVENAEAAS
jgi:hypothetical protein